LSVSHSTAPLTEFTVHCRQLLGHAAADQLVDVKTFITRI